MTEYFQALILTFIEALCCTIFFDTFFEERCCQSKNVSKWINQALVWILILLFLGIAIVFNKRYMMKAIASIIAICCIMKGIYRGKWLHVLFLSVVYYGLVILIDRMLLIFIQYVMNACEEEIWSNTVRSMVFALLGKNIIFLCILFFKKKFKLLGSFFLISDKEWIRLLLFPFVTIVCMTAFAIEREEMGKEVLIVSFGLILLNFLVFFMIQDIVRNQREKQEMQLIHERTKNQLSMYEYMEGIYDEQRKQLHDFKNHIACIQGLLKEKAYEQAGEYLHTVNNGWIDAVDYVNTNHAIVNSVLNQKYKQARKKGIAIILSVNNLQGIWLRDKDIVTIVSNMLDNAIEACEKVTKQSKNIYMRFWYEDNSIYISTKNPVDKVLKAQNGRIRTTKNNERVHGIGLINIKKVVEKYGGEDICSYQDGYFTHSIIIDQGTETAVL